MREGETYFHAIAQVLERCHFPLPVLELSPRRLYISEQTITFGEQYDPAIFATLAGNFAIIQDSYQGKTVNLKVSQPFLIATP